MIIQITYSRLRRASTVLEKFSHGNGEIWVRECFSLDTTPAGALEWILENSTKIKGFVFRGMDVTIPVEDLIPRRPIMPITPSDNDVFPPSWAGTRVKDFH